MHADHAADPPAAARTRPLAPLRRSLVVVILLATLPLVALACWQILADVRAEQDQIEANLARSATALAQAVDSELLASLDALTALSHADALRDGTPAQVRALLQSRPWPRRHWSGLFLLDREGRPLVQAGVGGAGPMLAELHRRVLQDGQPVVARDAETPAARGASVVLGVPVMMDGEMLAVLGARVDDAVWRRLAAGASRPDDGYTLLADAQLRPIAWAPAGLGPGTALPPEQAAALRSQASGVQRLPGVDGSTVYAAWQDVPAAGWSVQVGVPARPIDAGHRGAILAALATSGASLLAGVLLATAAARRITRPLQMLATQGHAGPGPIPVREIAMLRDALRTAARNDARARETLERDIAERKRVEQELLAAHEALQAQQRLIDLAQEAGDVGFFHYRFAGDALSWTPAHCKLFGRETQPEGGLQGWFGCIAEADRARVQEAFAATCAARRDTAALDYAVPRADGRMRWLSSRLLLRYDAGGAPVRATGLTVDMSDQRETELQRAHLTEQALAARQQAEAASRAKDEFLSMLGHELRNPLGAIAAAIDVLDAAAPGSAAGTDARAIIARQTRNLAHMVNDLLDVGRVIAGKILLAREPVNLAAVARRVRTTLELTGEAAAHEVRLQAADAWVDGDAVRLEQVVTNLVANAVKYTPAGRAIALRTGLRDGQAVLEVQDAGLGIPAALLPHVFDLFVQGERTLDRRAGGLGIGLTLVRRLAELHGGSVAVASSDAGSCFTVALPAIEPPPPVHSPPLPPSRRRRVLVVEDNADVLSALRSRLELDGHAVSTASDGIEGLSRLLRQQPEVSIVDIGLPGLTGYELARHARAAGYAGRMIALSGYGQDRDVAAARVAGFDDYLVKPVAAARLRASLGADG